MWGGITKLSVNEVLLPELRTAVERKDGYIMGARGQNSRTRYLNLIEAMCSK